VAEAKAADESRVEDEAAPLLADEEGVREGGRWRRISESRSSSSSDAAVGQ
jgi:hypothetical protein